MKIKTIAAVIAISLTSQVNAQWDTLSTGYSQKFTGIAFLNSNTGVVVGHDQSGSTGHIALQTADGGNTWTSYLGNGTGNHEYTDVDFTPSGTIWIIGDSGQYLHKAFPLTSHIASGYLTSYTLTCCSAVNDSVFYCAGELGLAYRTLDYGNTWDTLSSGTLTAINDIYFTNAANGWLVADGGYVATTADSGNTWTFVQQPLWGFYNMNSFALQSSSSVAIPFVVGQAGKAIGSLDSGSIWYNVTTGTSNDINCIQFGTENGGIMCGNNGFIYRTNDAAWTWTLETAPTSVDLFDISFAGDTTAFICGDSGVVLRSNVNVSSVYESPKSRISANAYPNPYNSALFINIQLEEQTDIHIRITDISGKELESQVVSNGVAGTNRIEVEGSSTLASGMYLITLETHSSSVTLPVIRQ